jgi:HJR/Mrr/RecB family endonuclease
MVGWRRGVGVPMSGETWSCFAQLPAGLIDKTSAPLTLSWLRPRPTHAGFKLTPSEIDAGRNERNIRVQRIALVALGMMFAAIAVVTGVDAAFELALFNDHTILFVAIWSTVAAVSAAALLVVLTALAILRYRSAAPKRAAFDAAVVEFEQIDKWRGLRCDAAFWSEGLDDASFEREVAELLAGFFSSGQIMLTRPDNDYGVDVLICAPQGRIVAQCKPWLTGIGAVQVRALAGAKAFFAADRAVLATIGPVSGDSEQARDIAAALRIDLWDVSRIVAVASQLRRAI